MGTTLADLASLVGGRVDDHADTLIDGAAIIRDVQAGQITLADRPELAKQLAQSQAAAVVVSENFPNPGLPCIVVSNVHLAFAMIVQHFQPSFAQAKGGIHPSAIIADSAVIEAEVEIGPGCVVGDEAYIGAGTQLHSGVYVHAGSKVGPNCMIFSGVVLYERTVVGENCIIHGNAVLGAYGFGYESKTGRHMLSAQLGNVILESEVEIGAGTTIDRGTYGATVIGQGTKIDNLVMIGHNCRIGKHNLLCSQVGIAGSTTTGDYVVMAGQVGVRDHVHIGTKAILGAKAGVGHDIPEGQNSLGIPAVPAKEKMLEVANLKKLPEMRRMLKQLAARLAQLEAAEEPLRKAS